MIKVIASDMDGTLLGDDHKIAPETQVAIKRACDIILCIYFLIILFHSDGGIMLKKSYIYRTFTRLLSVTLLISFCFLLA